MHTVAKNCHGVTPIVCAKSRLDDSLHDGAAPRPSTLLRTDTQRMRQACCKIRAPTVTSNFCSYENIYSLLHAKFAQASGATHMRTTEHVDANSASRYYNGINLRWCRKKPARSEKVKRQFLELVFVARKIRSGVRRNAHENDGTR